jgi:hypothetical protein
MNNPEKPATYGEQDEEKQNKNKERLYVGDIRIGYVIVILLASYVVDREFESQSG